MKTTDTPETDNHEAERDAMDTRAHADYIATLELCRDMERERDEWKAKYIHLKSQLTQTQGCVTISRNGYVQDLERERDEAREETIRTREFMDYGFAKAQKELTDMTAQRDRLAEALDELIITEGRGLDQWIRDAFAKAKQALAAVKGEEQ
jgi:hypothetical protein